MQMLTKNLLDIRIKPIVQ